MGKMSPKTKNYEARRQRIADLLHAHVPYKQITDITGASASAIQAVRRRLDNGESLVRPPQAPTTNKTATSADFNRHQFACKRDFDSEFKCYKQYLLLPA